LIANEDTLVRDAALKPQRLLILKDGEQEIEGDQGAISNWLLQHSLNPPEINNRMLAEDQYEHPMVRLLSKAARIRQYWLRQGDDRFADRILKDEYWKPLSKLLSDHNLLTIEKRDASGTDSTFYHIRYAGDILAEDKENPDIVAFYKALRGEIAA
jgi:hypothetical protein